MPLPASVLRDQRGFMIIEVLVSAVMLVGLGLATFSLIDTASSATAMNRARSVATVLAQNDQDEMRQLPFQELLNRSASARPLTVDGRKYTVTSKLTWINDTVGTSDCSSTSKAARYLKLTSSVITVGSSLKQPVVLETLRAPTLGQAGSGSVAVRLTRGDGGGTDQVAVNAGSEAGATNEFGCAFIDDVPEGVADVSWARTGYVNENGLNVVAASVAVRTDQTSIVTGSYDVGGAALVHFTDHRIADPSTITVADQARWISASVVNQGITSVPVGKRRFVIGSHATTLSAGTLFPFSNDYGYYAGTCDGNNPEAYVDGSGVAERVLAGVTSDVAVDLPALAVTVKQGSTPRSGYGVYAAPNTTAIAPNTTSTMNDCNESVTRAGGSSGAPAALTNSSGKTTIDLPYGIWDLCIDNNTSGGSARRYTVRVNNTPDGTPSPLAPSKVGAVRGISVNISSISSTSRLCA